MSSNTNDDTKHTTDNVDDSTMTSIGPDSGNNTNDQDNNNDDHIKHTTDNVDDSTTSTSTEPDSSNTNDQDNNNNNINTIDDSVSDLSQTALSSNRTTTSSSNNVILTKTAYRGLLITAIVGIAVGTFFIGYFAAFSTVGSSDYVTQSEFNGLLVQLQQQLGQQPQVPTGAAPPTPPQNIAVSLDDDPMLGDPNAPVTLIEFSDFQCPFCSKFHRETLPLIISQYVDTGKINFVYRDFPIDSIHPNARITHIASECADEQQNFWPYHDILFERQSEWNRLDSASAVNAVVEYASMLSLNIDEFSACLNSPEINREINADKSQGIEYGVSGTPAFFIGNEQSGYMHVNGAKPFDAFAQIIEQKLAS